MKIDNKQAVSRFFSVIVVVKQKQMESRDHFKNGAKPIKPLE
jgi:hypothetical protein